MYAGVHKKLGPPDFSNDSTVARTPFDIVAIAASAGGVSALRILLSELPINFPAPILIVQHLPASHRFVSRLPQVLGRSTNLKVKWAEQNEGLEAGVVYVAPQDRHVRVVSDRRISLSSAPKINHVRPAADPLFLSIAELFRERAVCVVLTGALSDGAQGVKKVAECGGRVLSQDQDTSAVFGMPYAAMRTGQVDFVLPLDVIARALIVLFMVAGGAAWFRVSRANLPAPKKSSRAIQDAWLDWYGTEHSGTG